MNYNTYPTNAPQEHVEDTAKELEYRKELAESIVAESTGTVGLFMSLDLDYAQKDLLKQTIASRNPEGADNTLPAGGGWQDWGERRLSAGWGERPLSQSADLDSMYPHDSPVRKLFRVNSTPHEDREEVAFIEMPDDTVELRYYYMATSYKDMTGRPGNAMNVGFTLSKEKASELRSALEADPNYIDDVIKSQILSLGMTQQNWDDYISPRDGFGPIKEDKLAIISATKEGDIQTERFAYADKKSILPAHEQSVSAEDAEPSLEETESLGNVWDESYDETLDLMHDLIAMRRDAGDSEDVVLTKLQEVYDSALNDMHESEAREPSDPEDVERTRATYIACGVAIEEVRDYQEHLSDQAARVQDQVNQVQVATHEVARAFTNEASESLAVGDEVLVGGEAMTVVEEYAMQNDAKTPMVVVRDSSGNQKHVKKAVIK
jgi:hypothetical protein